jgi:hypothetical protein
MQKTMLSPTNDFEALFQKAALNKFSLEYLDEVLNFYRKFEGLEEYKNIEFRCKSLASLIYSFNDFPEKSLEIDLELLAYDPNDHSGYYAVINGTIGTSAELNRTDEVLPFAVPYLKNQDDSFYGKLPVLEWYVKHFPDGENGSFDAFEPMLSVIVSKMGARTDQSLTFIDRVRFLYQDFKRAATGLDKLSLQLRGISAEERDKIIDEYLACENLGWFRDYVIQYYK